MSGGPQPLTEEQHRKALENQNALLESIADARSRESEALLEQLTRLESQGTEFGQRLDRIERQNQQLIVAMEQQHDNDDNEEDSEERFTDADGERLPGDKLVLGSAEWIGFPDHDIRMRARVDSGATTSSIHAFDISEFERDGDTWVRFTTSFEEEDGDDDEKIEQEIEAPLARRVEITQASGTEERLSVHLNMEVGPIVEEVEFTLSDRDALTFPVLLGRRFMQDIIVIDVGEEYLQNRPVFDDDEDNGDDSNDGDS